MTRIVPEPLLSAIRDRDEHTIARLLEDDPTLGTCRAPGGESVVLHACYIGAPELAPLLLSGRPPSACEAAALGDVEALRFAIENDDDSRVLRSSDGWTPLHLAAFFGNVDAVILLIDHDAPLDALSTNATRNTPLHAAFAGANNATIIRRLIFAGADVCAKAASNITPIHLAASRGDYSLCDLLITRGADPHALMDDGTTPAMLAEQKGFSELSNHLASKES